MKLSDRLSQTAATDQNPQRNYKSTDPLFLVRKKVADELYVRLGARLFDPHKDRARLEAMVAEQIKLLVAEFGTPLTGTEREEFVASVLGDVMGLGPIEPFLADPSITEVMVNSTDSIYVERAGKLEMTTARFVTEEHLRRVIDRIVAGIGRRVDESSPMVDARLADGSRVNAIIPPLAVDGPSLTIRKFSRDKMNMDQLVNVGALTREVADILAAAVRGARTIVVSGGTGTGKTTLLNVLSAAIPNDERIVTIEDAVELQLRQNHVVRLESRPANVEGRGEVTIRDLVRNALRMRPDRIIVGEVRGPEALDMLQAINTGHDGSLATVHANSPRDALARIETMVLMAGYDLPLRAIRQQIASGVDLIVQLTRFRDGSRKITQVTEVAGMEGEVISTSDLFTFDLQAGVDAGGRILGTLRSTGLRPSFLDDLATQGITVGDTATLGNVDPKVGARRRMW
jgi:pilus assembly protein CpaF